MNKNIQNGTVHNQSNAWGAVFVVAIAMSLYAYIRLTSNDVVLTVAIVVLTLLELARIAMGIRTSTPLEIAFDVSYFVVLLSVVLGAYRTNLSAHPTFLFATIFYRPKFMQHGSRRLALIISLLIVATVVPLTSGIVTDSGIVRVLTLAYAALVFSLWVFCSKPGSGLITRVQG